MPPATLTAWRHHHDRLVAHREQVPGERGLLDDVGALDDDSAIDLRAGQGIGDEVADLEHLCERQVRGGDEPPVDRLDLGDLLEAATVASSSSPRSVGTF